MRKVAIVGGGIAGISAALELSLQPSMCTFKLFESDKRLGGVLETERAEDYLVERSADNFATLLPSALDLTKEFADPSELISPEQNGRQAFVLHNGVLEPIPVGFSLMQPTRIGSILTTRTLSIAGKLRLIYEYMVPAREQDDDESLESFVTRRLGREAFENLVEPIVSGIFTADPSTLSMKATMPQFLKMEREHGGLIRAHMAAKKSDAAAAARKASGARYDQFVAPKHGMSSWISALTSQIPEEDLLLKTKVQSLEKRGNRWLLTSHSLDSQAAKTEEFDAVILATPSKITSRLLSKSLPSVANLVGDIHYASSVVVAMVVNKKDVRGRLDAFGMITPSKEQRDALAISYTSNKYDGRVPKQEILFRLFFGGAQRPELVELDDDELIKIAKEELRVIQRWTGKDPNWSAVIRWNEAMPQYTLGHTQRVKQIYDLLAPDPTIRLCGAAYEGVGIPQCVRGGRRAAKAILGE